MSLTLSSVIVSQSDTPTVPGNRNRSSRERAFHPATSASSPREDMTSVRVTVVVMMLLLRNRRKSANVATAMRRPLRPRRHVAQVWTKPSANNRAFAGVSP